MLKVIDEKEMRSWEVAGQRKQGLALKHKWGLIGLVFFVIPIFILVKTNGFYNCTNPYTKFALDTNPRWAAAEEVKGEYSKLKDKYWYIPNHNDELYEKYSKLYDAASEEAYMEKMVVLNAYRWIFWPCLISIAFGFTVCCVVWPWFRFVAFLALMFVGAMAAAGNERDRRKEN